MHIRFFSRTCCWIDDDGGYIHERCETCIDMGDGTYAHCKIKDGPVASEDPTIPPKPPKENIDETRAPINEGYSIKLLPLTTMTTQVPQIMQKF